MPSHTKATRSWLFTPGTRPERFEKAEAVGADVLIIDLEDAVAPGDKPDARRTALDWIAANKAGAIDHALRINGLDTAAGIADLDALLAHDAAPDYLVLPKTETSGHIEILDRLLSAADKASRIVGIIESARGLAAINAIAGSSPRLFGLVLGAADMAADLGCETAWDPLASIRSRIVAACALAGVSAIDSPFFDVHDPSGCEAEAAHAVTFGFVGKAAIHPAQIAPINKVLTPTPEAVEKARMILAKNAKGVGVVDGQMIDEAVARKARRVLAAAGG